MSKKTDIYDIRIGINLKNIRESKNLTQTEIAYVLKVTPQQIAKYESGKNRISASNLYKLSRYYYDDR
jgi:transcriptional regulator with XRE-family HTH domain